ncbi:histone-like nucleoid-structuring protein Lsr2 [Streptomyces sp. NPDC050507]|uniref:Lsr2 dimerization domain-containing protein n=1 Tax=Streptomyces sp. NPDC050507 TaxID=3365619 RepID=UPI0037A1AF0B
MARRIVLDDDIDGTSDDTVETHRFNVDGQWLELDMNAKNAAKFRKALEPYVAAARPAEAPEDGAAPKRAARGTATTGGGRRKAVENAPLRTWWKANAGKKDLPEFAETGRIPAKVREAYGEANPS